MLELTKAQRDQAVFIDLNNLYAPGGRSLLVVNLESIGKKIYNVLTTNKGTLIMEPQFGCDLESYLQDPTDPQTVSQIENEILNSITEWVDEISINPSGIKITIDQAEPRFFVSLTYTIRATGTVDSVNLSLKAS